MRINERLARLEAGSKSDADARAAIEADAAEFDRHMTALAARMEGEDRVEIARFHAAIRETNDPFLLSVFKNADPEDWRV